MSDAIATRPAVNLIMPMAGRGSRFAAEGYSCPKPLIDLAGRPFFWWATESVARSFAIVKRIYVVLAEHIVSDAIDQQILRYYPDAVIVALPEVTAGALETAIRGLEHVDGDAPLIINDCDHCFEAAALASAASVAPAELPAAMLCHFIATKPIYSFALYDLAGRLLRTAEKQPISDLAIAGAYWFNDAAVLQQYAERYRRDCPYQELFVSGIYNTMAGAGETIKGAILSRHLPFGVPTEYRQAKAQIAAFADWLTV
jgi:NDP-sugar pyrophosphorylase family protein